MKSSLVLALAAVLFLGGCGRNDGNGVLNGLTEASFANGPASTNTPADILQPYLGKHVITKFLNKTNVKGTLEVVVTEFPVKAADGTLTNVLKAGVLIRPLPGDASGLKSEDLVRDVVGSTFTKAANGAITTHFEVPGSPLIHLDLTFAVAAGSLVVSSRNCTAEACQLEKFTANLAATK